MVCLALGKEGYRTESFDDGVRRVGRRSSARCPTW